MPDSSGWLHSGGVNKEKTAKITTSFWDEQGLVSRKTGGEKKKKPTTHQPSEKLSTGKEGVYKKEAETRAGGCRTTSASQATTA